MPTNKDLRDFYELRTGLEGAMEFFQAALTFMDDQGIALGRVKRKVNGAVAAPNMDAIREKVKGKFVQRRKRRNGSEATEPDGQHVTAKEAAKILKMSDAAVRLYEKQGKLPKPTYEKRTSKGRPDNPLKVQVWLRSDIEAFAERRKQEAKGK